MCPAAPDPDTPARRAPHRKPRYPRRRRKTMAMPTAMAPGPPPPTHNRQAWCPPRSYKRQPGSRRPWPLDVSTGRPVLRPYRRRCNSRHRGTCGMPGGRGSCSVAGCEDPVTPRPLPVLCVVVAVTVGPSANASKHSAAGGAFAARRSRARIPRPPQVPVHRPHPSRCPAPQPQFWPSGARSRRRWTPAYTRWAA